MAVPNYVGTYSGGKVSLVTPRPEQIRVEDIAQGLSNLCRYTGQTEVPYPVAEHSLHVARLLEVRGASREIQLVGLLHDASEAYLGDVSSPLKALLPSYGLLETLMTRAIFERFNVPTYHANMLPDSVKRADYDVFCVEVDVFFGAESREEIFRIARAPDDAYETFLLEPTSRKKSREDFLELLEELS